jgi:penicillin-binding protein 1A
MQMVAGYAVFANGGMRVNPYLITRITDQQGKVLVEPPMPVADESQRVIEARNAYLMSSLLQEITRSGTAARAQAQLRRSDLYGKTGTTNDSIDTWFVGYQPTVVAGVWMGYDKPRKLGDRETGGGLSLPVWIGYMEHALKSVPVTDLPVPPDVVQIGGEWYYEEFARGNGVTSLGVDGRAPEPAPAPVGTPVAPAEDRRGGINATRP